MFRVLPTIYTLLEDVFKDRVGPEKHLPERFETRQTIKLIIFFFKTNDRKY